MQFLDLILKKRNGYQLTKEEIDFFISGYINHEIPDYQVSSLLMAIWFSKMNDRETADLTFAIRDSGDVIDLSSIKGIKADKHSTGGVADTTTLITTPIVAACGLKVAKISGRGLGHTGGTLDKLESIPGYSTQIEMDRFKQIVNDCGLSVIGQTKKLVPADRLLYALRDVTGTIDNISLISASIMSKKLASGSDIIVLDVKTGNGAFMKEIDDARQLAKAMVAIGKAAGKKVTALVTDMNQPLGNAVGNALEVKEAIEVLQGKHNGDLKEISLTLASKMIQISGMEKDDASALNRANHALSSGKALRQLEQMIKYHGGDPSVCQDTSKLPISDQILSIKAIQKGYISKIATNQIGMAALLLGAGRVKKTDIIDPSVGIWLKARLGDQVNNDDVLAHVYINDRKNLDQAIERCQNAFTIEKKPPTIHPLIYDILN